MLPVERIIGEEGLSSAADGVRLAMRLPWYRSLPFSIYEIANLAIDGEAVDLSDAKVEYEGNSWPLAELGDQTDAFWFVRDSAYLHLPSRQLAAGSEHEISLMVHISPPYIPGMKRTDRQTETLRVS
jgi:hypothetical protein